MKPLGKVRESQKGMTVFGGFLLLVFVGAIILVIVKLAPSYIENYNVKRVLIDLVDDESVRKLPPHELRETVLNRLSVSGIHDKSNMKIVVKRTDRGRQVNIDYVVRKPIVGNLDALMTFHEDVEIIRR